MNRVLVVSCAATALTLSAVAGAGGALAFPPPPGTLCSYTLSPPEVVQVSGQDLVTATMTPDGCAGAFRPHITVVCVQGAGAANQCSQAREGDVAQVFAPYRAGVTYTSTGRGLGTLFNDMSEPNWQLVGPLTAVL
jgi:hypothetical protein